MADETWAAVILRDGRPVTGPVPINRWEAASILAPLVVGMMGGPVSVAGAVHDDTPPPAAAPPEAPDAEPHVAGPDVTPGPVNELEPRLPLDGC